jgi:L-2-hydroxycarboxylate dehydrogenase (NAD+)
MVTRGDVLLKARNGSPLPANSAIDKDGEVTTDAQAVDAILPIGGHKGAALALAVQALAVLAGGLPIPSPGVGYALLFIALRTDAFISAASYNASLRALLDAVTDDEGHETQAQVRLPGEQGEALLAQARLKGFDVPDSLFAELTRLSGM